MSDTTDDSRRTRRRAVRTAGPPVEESDPTGATGPAASAAAETVAARPGTDDSTGTSDLAESTQPGTAATAGDVASAKRSDAGKRVGAGPEADAQSSAGTKRPNDEETEEEAVGPAAVMLSKPSDAEEMVAEGEAVGPAAVAVSESPDAEGKAAGEDTTDRERSGADRSLLRRIVPVAAVVVLLAVLIAGAVVSVFTVDSLDRQADRRTEYVQTAEQAILNLTTINADTAKEDIDRILSLASGKFKTEFDGRVDPFLTIVQQAEVRATGEIIEAALESDEENSAKVLVAAKQSLTNAGQEGPQTRYYRFRVTVSESDSGLTASNVEFVP